MGFPVLPTSPALNDVRSRLHAVWTEPYTGVGLQVADAERELTELPQIHEIVAARPTGKAGELARTAAQDLGEIGEAQLWDRFLKDWSRGASAKQAKAGAKLLENVRSTNDAVFDGLKTVFARRRPFQVDPSIDLLVKRPGSWSFPSGHAARSFANAEILSFLDPAHATKYRAAAEEVALSRVYAGAHFPSDVVAGAKLGHSIAQGFVQTLAHQAEVAHKISPLVKFMHA